jgi:hypothetical protein
VQSTHSLLLPNPDDYFYKEKRAGVKHPLFFRLCYAGRATSYPSLNNSVLDVADSYQPYLKPYLKLATEIRKGAQAFYFFGRRIFHVACPIFTLSITRRVLCLIRGFNYSF